VAPFTWALSGPSVSFDRRLDRNLISKGAVNCCLSYAAMIDGIRLLHPRSCSQMPLEEPPDVCSFLDEDRHYPPSDSLKVVPLRIRVSAFVIFSISLLLYLNSTHHFPPPLPAVPATFAHASFTSSPALSALSLHYIRLPLCSTLCISTHPLPLCDPLPAFHPFYLTSFSAY